MIKICLLMLLVAVVFSACSTQGSSGSEDVRVRAKTFLAGYESSFYRLQYDAQLAEWASNTRIVEGDDTNARRTEASNEALAAFTGSVENIETARDLLDRSSDLDDLTVRQLESVLFRAANKPQTVPDVVKKRIAAEAAQNERLYGFKFTLDGKEVTANDIDRALKDEKDLSRRRAVWECSKSVGPTLKPGLETLRDLRNETVQSLGYRDFFTYMVSEYGMSNDEMIALLERINAELRPLYRELHTWARYELAARYGQPVPELLPADWLPNRWGQDWNALADVEGFDLDAGLAGKPASWLVEQAERFYVSLGFSKLPEVFWRESSLYPLPPDAGYKKNNHASAWHMDLQSDVRSLMSVESNAEWYETTHHELGHIYYYLEYSNPEVPLLLREGANRAYHEAIGSLMGLAAMQPRFAAGVGLVDASKKPDPTRTLLKEALNYVVFIPWSTGTMSRFEHALYAENLPADRWNAKWWELAARYQGIAPPSGRGEEYCDAATKTHINDDPAGYYDYALSFVLLFQLHRHIAVNVLHEDPHDTNYFGRKEVGDFLRAILRPGASADWRKLLRETTGSDLSAAAMVEYFSPLLEWLQKENAGRRATLP